MTREAARILLDTLGVVIPLISRRQATSPRKASLQRFESMKGCVEPTEKTADGMSFAISLTAEDEIANSPLSRVVFVPVTSILTASNKIANYR